MSFISRTSLAHHRLAWSRQECAFNDFSQSCFFHATFSFSKTRTSEKWMRRRRRKVGSCSIVKILQTYTRWSGGWKWLFLFPLAAPIVDETKCESDDAIDFHIKSRIKHNRVSRALISSRLPLIEITFSSSYSCFYFSSIFMTIFINNIARRHLSRTRSPTGLNSTSTDSSVEIEKSNC